VACHRWFSANAETGCVIEKSIPLVPKILLCDIETLPLEVITWGIYEQHISHQHIIRDGCMLSWSAKWLNDSDIVSDVLTPDEAINKSDKRIVETLWPMLDNCDMVIFHNGVKFDVPVFQGRLLKHHIMLPSYYKVIDTYLVARKAFRLTCNKLDYLLEFLGYEGKISTDIELWKRCLVGDPEALIEMDTYCRGDVWKLEEVYMDMLPYMANHPNVNLWSGKDACPNCGSENRHAEKDYQGTTYLYDAYRCDGCGSLWRSRKKKK
jgi:hypothetical protein